MSSLKSWIGRGLRRPAVRCLPHARPRLNRLEDRTVPSGTTYYPPSYFLTNPNLTAVGPQAAPAEPLNASLRFLSSHASELGLAPADLFKPIVTSEYTDTDTEITHLYLQQQVNGLPVVNADFTIGIAANGVVISAGGGFVHDLQDILGQTGTPWPGMSAESAVRAAANDLGLPLSTAPIEINPFVGPVARPIKSVVVRAPSLSLDPVTAQLVYAPTPDGGAAEGWELVIRTTDNLHWYDMTVDGKTGAVLSQADWIDNDNYDVVPPPNESPQDGGFNVISNPANPIASPFGWEDTNGVAGPEFTTTQGNNVDAHLDVNGDNIPDPSPGRPDGGAALDFSGFTYNPALAPSVLQNQDAAQVNLFYIDNLLHDVHYQYGFTEAAGNFQVNNYGRGGIGNDPVQADAQDGSGTNNANFATPVDGTSGRMQMYIWTETTPNRDGDLDNSIIIHEFGHGVSNRLTGGPANSSALNATQSGGMGEGWSDFYALMFLQRPSDTQNAGYGIGTYVLGESQTGLGIRRKQYSFNMSIDPLMWDAYGTSGTTSYGITRSTEVHNTGELWTSTLWDMNWLLINKYGYDPDLATGWSASPGPGHAGNKLALRLVMDAMKLQPANPSFTQARDAIIAADTALNGGADLYEIWEAFARRGLGQGSSSGASNSTALVTISTTLPMLVQSVGPATGAVVSTHPTSYTLNVTAPIDPATLDASDFLVNGQPATNVTYTPGSTTATFTFATDPVTVEGPQTIQVAANSFFRASDESPVSAYSSTFYYDATPLTVATVAPAAGSSVSPPLNSIDVNLNQPIDPASVQNNDLSISRGTVTGFSLLNGNTTVRFTVANLTTELPLTVYVAAGAFLDLQGNPNAAFNDGTVNVDIGTAPFPTPLQSVAPLGSLAYQGSTTGNIGFAGDTDSFTVNLDANQTISLKVTPDAGLRPSIIITGPGTNQFATASAAGASAQLNGIPITTAGIYTFTVGGLSSTTGNYTIQASLNDVPEAESNGGSSNDTLATAQSLTPVLLNLGGGLQSATIAGVSDQSGRVNEAEPNGTTATANSGATYSASPGNLYQMGISGGISSSTDTDFFNIGAMQAGDVLTISESGVNSSRGTEPDSYLELYRAGSSSPVTFDDDGGPGTDNGHDSLIYRFTITTPDTYYIHAYRFSSTETGTYQLGVMLENSGPAPNTGATFTTEVEPNDSIAGANDASSAWRPVKYLATAAGSISSGDTDIYSYHFTAGDVVTLITHATSPTLAPTAALLNAAGTVIASDDGSSTVATAGGLAPLYGFVIPSTGTYYFRVTGANSTTGTYTADVSLSTTATLPLAPPAQDLYSFNLSAGQLASAVIKGATTGVDVSFLDSTGTVVATGTAGATNVDEIVSNFVAPAGGTYFLRVGSTTAIPYQTTVVIGGTFDAEPNDSFATAQPLVAGSAVLGDISGSDDWYQLNLAIGTGLTLSTTTPGDGPGEFTNNLDPAIELYDPNGNLVASDDNSGADGRNATLTMTAALAGNYRVHVSGANGTTGEYTLNSSILAPPPQVSTVVVNDGSAERSEVRSIAVTFSGPVNFAGGDTNAAAAFQLTHIQTGINVDLTSVVSTNLQGQTVVALNFSGTETDFISGQNSGQLSLADGRYTLTILAANVTGTNGLNLDGAGAGTPGSNYVSPSDTLGGGPGQLHLYRLFGDANGDGTVDQLDLGQFRSTFNGSSGNPAYLAYLDADNSGTVDQLDLGQFRTRFNLNVF